MKTQLIAINRELAELFDYTGMFLSAEPQGKLCYLEAPGRL